MMPLLERMRGFLLIAVQDQRLTTMHICIYVVLCIVQDAEGLLIFSISRRMIMSRCKIKGIATYHKCIRELQSFGYIQYFPSFHPTKGSQVLLNDFNKLIQ